MDSLTHFHSRNLHFYIHYCYSLKVAALDMFKKNLGSHPLKIYCISIIMGEPHVWPANCGTYQAKANVIDVLNRVNY